MIPRNCNRLAEADFPSAEVSQHAALEGPAEEQVQAGATEPKLQEPIQDPARLDRHEVTKGAHYFLWVDALTQPMRVREGPLGWKRREE